MSRSSAVGPWRRLRWRGAAGHEGARSASPRLCSTCTAARDSSAELTSNDGFSVVAPMKVNRPTFHMRQEGVLLALVEAVHLVDKDDGAPPACGRCAFQRGALRHLLHRLADVLDAAQHRRHGDELRVKRVGHQPRHGGLAHTGRPPQDAANVRLARLERHAQRLALAQQVLLADHLVQGARAQALGQRRVRRRVAPSTAACLRAVTWFRSRSCSHSVWPSATMVCSNGFV
jgi:hypothetical protein